MLDLALLNGSAFINGEVKKVNIFTKGPRIAKISRSSSEQAEKTLDCTGLLILPGVIDSHVHFREPGLTHKEDWETGSASAAAGGVCTVIDMPNTMPPTTTAELLEEKRKLAEKKSVVDFRLHFGATGKNTEEILKAEGFVGLKVFMASSTGNLLLENDDDILAAFKAAAHKRVPAVVHAEDEMLVRKCVHEAKSAGRNDALAHCEARSPAAATRGAERAIKLSASAGNRLHLLHVSTEGELAAVRAAKESGLPVTCEATPTHLFLNMHDVNRLGCFAKLNPPLRSERDRAALLRALESGLIDTVGSDHAPHTKEEKQESVWKAPSGVPGVQTLLPLLLNEHLNGNISLRRLVEVTSGAPARIFGLSGKGDIAVGYNADFSIVDLKREWVIKDDMVLSKCGWTPFHGKKVKGRVEKTIVSGELVFEAGSLFISP